MKITKETRLCISISARPSDFGATLHNAGYQALGLNWVYLGRKATDAASAMAGVRGLDIRGCGVSMPFKEAVIPFLDALDATAQAVGAVNTVVNDAGRLTGFNTDVIALEQAIGALRGQTEISRALLLGAGGMAKAALLALQRAGLTDVTLANRTPERAAALHDRTIPWAGRADWAGRRGALLVNATSVGMAPDAGQTPFPEAALAPFAAVIDAVAVPPETRLMRAARGAGLPAVGGPSLIFRQALAQFRLYTESEPPEAAMRTAFDALMG